MLRIEMNLVHQAENLAAATNPCGEPKIVEKVIAKHHEKFKKDGGLSPRSRGSIRHMLASNQISCVVGFAGAGKTTVWKLLKKVGRGWVQNLGVSPYGESCAQY